MRACTCENGFGGRNEPTRIFESIYPDTWKCLDEEEFEHIKELINERSYIFGLPGEKLKAMHLVTHKIETTTTTGLRNAPATFQALMHLTLSGLQGVELYVYLDDIIIFASSLEEHGKKFRRLTK